MTINWKHIGTILAGTVLPAMAAAVAGRPLTWGVAWQVMGAGATTLVAVLLGSPMVDPGVTK